MTELTQAERLAKLAAGVERIGADFDAFTAQAKQRRQYGHTMKRAVVGFYEVRLTRKGSFFYLLIWDDTTGPDSASRALYESEEMADEAFAVARMTLRFAAKREAAMTDGIPE